MSEVERDERWKYVRGGIKLEESEQGWTLFVVTVEVLYGGVIFADRFEFDEESYQRILFDPLSMILDRTVERIDERIDLLSSLELTGRFDTSADMFSPEDFQILGRYIRDEWHQLLNGAGFDPTQVPSAMSTEVGLDWTGTYRLRWDQGV